MNCHNVRLNLRAWTISLALVPIACSSSEQLVTRAYQLRSPEVETRLINSVLEREWQEHDVTSRSEVSKEGYAVVKTSARGHARIKEALASVHR